MKIDLSQWTDSVGRSVRKLQGILNQVWSRQVQVSIKKSQPLTKAVFKYKKVDQKIRPIPSLIPRSMKAQRQFPQDPLRNLPHLPFHPQDFQPAGKITTERIASMGVDENPNLLPEEKKLLKHVIALNERSFAFDEHERGTF